MLCQPQPVVLAMGKLRVDAELAGHRAVERKTPRHSLRTTLSYRDDRYFDFVKTRAFQFPLAHLYNHDPIYGNTANLAGKMDDDEFRTYLMMMATRGSAFWELIIAIT